MSDEVVDAVVVLSLEDRWESIQCNRKTIAIELDRMISDFPGPGERQLRSLRDWFRGPADFHDALERPDVLAICLPLVDPAVNLNPAIDVTAQPATDEQPAVAATAPLGLDITTAIRTAFGSMVSQPRSSGQHIIRLLIYPMLVMLAAWMLWVGVCFWLLPQFEEMFEEFGIGLPAPTEGLFRMARFVRLWWWLMIILPLVFLSLVLIFNRIGDRRSRSSSWLDSLLMGTRHALANWIWHLSLLLEAGITEETAVAIAGAANEKAWLRRKFRVPTAQDPVRPTRFASLPDPNNQPTFAVFHWKFQLLNTTLSIPPSRGKFAALRVVAAYYWERSRNVGDWWVHWLVTFVLLFVGAMVAFLVLSLFMPLIAIIGGLT